MSISCAAILCVRNEAVHIRHAINNFVIQGIDVVVIDHGSTDDTIQICEQFKNRGLLKIHHLSWNGSFDLSLQLEAKQQVAETVDHDWIIHADADECLRSSVEGETLLEGIVRKAEAGFNVINFEEFVFLPYSGQHIREDQYQKELLSYYFFAPRPCRLMRAWERSSKLKNISSGGHELVGDDIRISDEPFVLKHYITLSRQHLISKYEKRIFSESDINRGWHGNRLNLDRNKLQLPSADSLKTLSHWRDPNLDKSDPKTTHFWDW